MPARQPLTPQRIFEAALRLIDRGGLDKLTMRKLGAELGVEAMAIYYHVPSKQALLDGVVETVLASIDPPAPAGLEWNDYLRKACQAFRRQALAHPAVLPLLFGRPLQTRFILERTEAVLAALRASGLDEQCALDAYRTIGSYAVGFVTLEVQFRNSGLSEADWRPNSAHLPPAEFPATVALAPFQATRDWDAQFAAGLDLIFDAIRSWGGQLSGK